MSRTFYIMCANDAAEGKTICHSGLQREGGGFSGDRNFSRKRASRGMKGGLFHVHQNDRESMSGVP